jgi:uncharacterized iron-regulated membrane protein
MALLKTSWPYWHRRLGIVTCFGVLMWGLSGLSHPIMTRLQPSPVAFSPPVQMVALQGSTSPREILEQHAVAELQRLNVVSFNQENYYRVSVGPSQSARYFAVDSGQELMDGDRLYAEYLASHYTGLPLQNVHQSRLVTAFSDDYHELNRLLPVWRVEFAGDGHLRAFIDADQSRLATLVDDTRFTMTRLFRLGHNWSFAEGNPLLQVSIMALVLAAALTSALSGLYMYFSRRKNAKARLGKQPLRRWHRRMGLLVAVSTLLFASSGGFHLIMSFKQEQAFKPNLPTNSISTAQLADEAWQQVTLQPLASIDLVVQHGRPLWLVRLAGEAASTHAQVGMLTQEKQAQEIQNHEHHHEHHLHSAKPTAPSPPMLHAADGLSDIAPKDLLELAKTTATDYAKQPLTAITNVELVERFGGEYGFVFKRLPVVKVQFKGEGNPRYYIEPVTGELAAEIRDLDAIEGWSFATLHKWSFADFNKDLRDILVSLFALGNILVALMGLAIFSRRPSAR